MRSESEIREVFRLHAEGLTTAAIVRETGISRSHVKRLVTRGEDSVFRSPFRARGPCRGGEACELVANVSPEPYAYLLGQYLGDGHVVRTARAYRLEVYCCAAYPNIIEECANAMSKVLPHNSVGYRHRTGVVAVGCYSKHLPCLFPQHGPGLKHTRPIILAPWQEFIAVETFSRQFVRGLIHSDGCRGINRVRNAKRTSYYEYERYQFSNRSGDIRGIFTRACDVLGIEWRQMNRWTISVAKGSSVAILDQFVGPKS